jgi:hypothetical protein
MGSKMTVDYWKKHDGFQWIVLDLCDTTPPHYTKYVGFTTPFSRNQFIMQLYVRRSEKYNAATFEWTRRLDVLWLGVLRPKFGNELETVFVTKSITGDHYAFQVLTIPVYDHPVYKEITKT